MTGEGRKTFRNAVRNKSFVLSAELFLHPETTAAMVGEQTRLLKDHVDGILVTDNLGGKLHMSPLAAASLIISNGGDPIMQLSCRNRNRITLLAELLGAAALDVSSLLLIRGSRVPDGFEPRPPAVFDVDAAELIAMATKMKRDEGLPGLPDFYVGGLITPHAPKPGWVPEKLQRKSNAGVQFALSHISMDTSVLRAYMEQIVASGLKRRMNIFISLAICSSADDARWLRDNLPNNRIPDEYIARLAQAADPEAMAIQCCAEQLRELQDIPGIDGAHLIATRNLTTINAAIDAAGLAR
jgi:methylenetetrahydrofolate reductase (NADH)